MIFKSVVKAALSAAFFMGIVPFQIQKCAKLLVINLYMDLQHIEKHK